MKKYFISSLEIIEFRPLFSFLVESQPLLQLIKSKFPDSPISGNILLKIENGYKIKCVPDVKNNGFIYTFEKDLFKVGNKNEH